MPSELDQKFDAMLARVTGPGGRLVIEQDEQGRAIVANFTGHFAGLVRRLCELYGRQPQALIAGDER
jgi:hypothetical protein